MSVFSFREHRPTVHDTAFIASTASLIGDVSLGPWSSAFYGVTVRGDTTPIRVGEGTNLQDNVVVHADPGYPAIIGAGVSVGHGAVVHGCTVEDGCLIGMGATILNGALIGSGSLVAAGAVVLEDTIVPPHSLVAGVPAKVRRRLTADEVARLKASAKEYMRLAQEHKGSPP
ncbi:gamma carbonic anhydrase family protein [Arthrobacter subterraneus]|uniref:gamma carbonic anhydrase family protein n=1 Tax=Arthrobacter subterraneus TaxID=335973 RepID=UPI00382D072C